MKPGTGVHLPGGPVYIGRLSPAIDVTTVLDIWNDEMFPAECRGRIVLDIGAHKGYFGAWALHRGAVGVVSCEPERDNFDLLQRARRENARAADWQIKRIAIGGRSGEVRLFLSAESWAHSLYERMIHVEGSEMVPMRVLADIITLATDSWPAHAIVLKVNVEGAAGAVLLPATALDLRSVVEIHLDHEPGSPFTLDQVLEHLGRAGLDEVDARGTGGRLLTIRRSKPAVGAQTG